MSDVAFVMGGAGFLGSHVADALSDAGYKVRVFDRVRSPFLREDQEMVIGDILDLDGLTAAMEGARYVYNFAGLADIDDAKNRPIDTVKLNILGNTHALEAARIQKIERFVFASSIYVYSESGSFYRASKQSAERFVETYQERYGLDYSTVRYGSLYGRRADARNGIYRFLKQALVEKRIKFSGSPDAQREYIHVQDAARLSVEVLKPEFRNRHIILTGNERMSVVNLMKMIAELSPAPVQLEFDEMIRKAHYEMTPYAFNPRIGTKLVSNEYVDLGQGLMDCLAEIYETLHAAEYMDTPSGWLAHGDHEVTE